MTRPKQVKCQLAGCKSGETEDGDECAYWMDPDCSSVAERSADLKDHVHMVHAMAKEQEELRIREKECDVAKYKAETRRLGLRDSPR